MRKICILFITLSIITVCMMSMAFSAHAVETATSGTCGDNLTWILDDTGTLTISGSGIMYDYRYGSSPWFSNSQIENIIIEDGVTSIGEDAFTLCSNLTSITIPRSIANIGKYAFSQCSKLNNTYITDIIAWCSLNFPSESSNPLSWGGNLFLNGELVTDLFIPEGVTYIGSQAFIGYKKLNSITFSDTVTDIGYYSFSYCRNLTVISIPDSVKNIGYCAFTGCDSLHHVSYAGTHNQWNSIIIDNHNTDLTDASVFHLEASLEHVSICTEYSIYCPVCGKNLINKKIDNNHNYEQQSIITSPTFSTEGMKQKICAVCGDQIIEKIPTLIGKVREWNIILEDDYAVNFYLQISESIENTAKVRITIGNETSTHNVSALEKTADGHYLLNANISAAQMNDFIVVMVMNGREIGSNTTYSVRQYCDTILADSAHSEYHQLVKEMLNYGAMAQQYFGYDTENLANDGITCVAAMDVPETAEEITVNDSIDALNFYGASLVYRDRIAVRYYFTGDMTGMVFTANGNTYSPIAKDGMFYVEIADILPQDLDQQITLTVTGLDGNTLTVSYGPMNYMVRMNAKGDEKTQNLMKALYNYHLAAKAL